MAHEIETMFYTREVPWHGLGTKVSESPASKDALQLAGIDWQVNQEPVFTQNETVITGYRANVRSTDRKVLGIVTDRYKVVQNTEAFEFTDALLGEGVRYETAGSIQEGRKVWLLAHLPRSYVVFGETISPYLVFSNTHDGSGSVKVAITPIRVVCNNTLNLAISTAKRCFSMMHTKNIREKMKEAKDTLFMAESYMQSLGMEFETLRKKSITDEQVKAFIEELIPVEDENSVIHIKNIKRLREDLAARYYEAPDLLDVGKNAYRFVNACSDFATHAKPLRMTAGYKENLFARTIEGHPFIDRAYQMVKAA